MQPAEVAGNYDNLRNSGMSKQEIQVVPETFKAMQPTVEFH
jgi:hypothetical protein